VHLENIRRSGAAELAGVCDTRPLTAELRALTGDVPSGRSLPDLLATVEPDVTVIVTPIHTHVDLALTAAAAGSHVLLEKPPAPELAEFDRLADGMAAHGRVCQVGFQSLGSAALPAVRARVADGEIGEVTGISAIGLWARGDAYYRRAPWAGRRRMDGVPVMDGVLTNSFAHSVANALVLAGTAEGGGLDLIETDLYHANDIEADDTSSLRLRTASGTTVLVAATLCAERTRDPEVTVHGTRGSLTLAYTSDEVRSGGGPARRYPRADLLDNLLAHLGDPGVALLAPLSATRAVTAVVEAIGAAPPPAAIPAGAWFTDPGTAPPEPGGSVLERRAAEVEAGPRRVVRGIDEAVTTAAGRQLLFRELGVPWATR
jgi:predicted dehydrogenase